MNRREIQFLIRDLEKQGFVVRRTGSGHYAVHKEGVGTVFMPHSPSDGRAMPRIYRKLKTIGYERRRK